MAENHAVTTILCVFLCLLPCKSEECTIPDAWQNKMFSITSTLNGNLRASFNKNISFGVSTAIWEEPDSFSSWRCHYVDNSFIVLKSTAISDDDNITFHCLLHKTINESLIYLHAIQVNGSRDVSFPETYNPMVCEICNGTEAELYILYVKENLTCGCIPDCGISLFENACTHLLETPIQCDSSTATPSISTVSNSSGWSRHQTTSNPVAFTTRQEYEKTTIDPFGVLVHRSGLYIGYGLSGLLFAVVSVTWLCRGCRLLQRSCERRRLMKNRVNVICVEEANPREVTKKMY